MHLERTGNTHGQTQASPRHKSQHSRLTIVVFLLFSIIGIGCCSMLPYSSLLPFSACRVVTASSSPGLIGEVTPLVMLSRSLSLSLSGQSNDVYPGTSFYRVTKATTPTHLPTGLSHWYTSSSTSVCAYFVGRINWLRAAIVDLTTTGMEKPASTRRQKKTHTHTH